MISKQRIYLNADGEAVAQGAKGARTLLVGKGVEISDKILERHKGALELASEEPASEVLEPGGGEGTGDGDEPDGLDELTVRELKDVAKKESVEIPENAKKAEIIEAIRTARK